MKHLNFILLATLLIMLSGCASLARGLRAGADYQVEPSTIHFCTSNSNDYNTTVTCN